MATWKRTFFAAWIAQFLSITGFAFVLPFLPLYIEKLGVEGEAEIAFWAGLCGASTAIMLSVFAPIWGSLADRFGRKLMVVRAMYGGAIILTMMGLAKTVEQLALCRMLQGMFTGTMTACMALVASVAPAHRSGFALGTMQAAVYAGVTLGPLLGGELVGLFGYECTFAASGVMLFLGGLLVHFAAREGFEKEASKDRAARGNYRQVLAATGFLSAVLVLFALRFGNGAPSPVFALLIRNLYDGPLKPEVIAGRIIGVAGLAAVVASALFGYLGDHWGHRRFLLIFTVAAAILSALHAYATDILQLFVLRMLFGLCAAGMMPAANALIRQSVDQKNIGKAFGVMSSISSLGIGAGPLLGGMIVAELGLRGPFILATIVLAGAAAIVLWRIPEDEPVMAALKAERREDTALEPCCATEGNQGDSHDTT